MKDAWDIETDTISCFDITTSSIIEYVALQKKK